MLSVYQHRQSIHTGTGQCESPAAVAARTVEAGGAVAREKRARPAYAHQRPRSGKTIRNHPVATSEHRPRCQLFLTLQSRTTSPSATTGWFERSHTVSLVTSLSYRLSTRLAGWSGSRAPQLGGFAFQRHLTHRDLRDFCDVHRRPRFVVPEGRGPIHTHC
jgi:hypothetical protein